LNANGTFLWVALVCQELANTRGHHTQKKLAAFPPGLNALYRRMMDQISTSEDAELCKQILAVVSAVYRPLSLDELSSFVEIPCEVSGDNEAESDVIQLCGSFLTLRERTVFFVHQSAKDFLLGEALKDISASGIKDVHRIILSRSLQVMSKTLRRDIYKLRAPWFPIDKVDQPVPDPLAAARYSCGYWIHHLLDYSPSINSDSGFWAGGSINEFLRQRYLYWLEALSLCRSMADGVLSMTKLQDFIEVA
jgi:hypothetical protein